MRRSNLALVVVLLVAPACAGSGIDADGHGPGGDPDATLEAPTETYAP